MYDAAWRNPCSVRLSFPCLLLREQSRVRGSAERGARRRFHEHLVWFLRGDCLSAFGAHASAIFVSQKSDVVVCAEERLTAVERQTLRLARLWRVSGMYLWMTVSIYLSCLRCSLQMFGICVVLYHVLACLGIDRSVFFFFMFDRGLRSEFVFICAMADTICLFVDFSVIVYVDGMASCCFFGRISSK